MSALVDEMNKESHHANTALSPLILNVGFSAACLGSRDLGPVLMGRLRYCSFVRSNVQYTRLEYIIWNPCTLWSTVRAPIGRQQWVFYGGQTWEKSPWNTGIGPKPLRWPGSQRDIAPQMVTLELFWLPLTN
ncbi:hypothetical protein C8R44DRAFT_746076 [Mycena epipterygia]|nr:hypothetical protein C8R44DRAFT_746076 [Mycena epipterygia]